MIRFATEKDIDSIMEFIDTYWKRGHILGNNKDFFVYEHKLDEGITYVISIDEDESINAILGYIPYGKTNRDVMTVMWKANHTANSSLGLELFHFLKTNGDVRIMASPGSNPKLKGLYRYLGYQFGKMTQWYRLRKQGSYRIARVTERSVPDREIEKKCVYKQFNDWDDVKEKFDFENYTRTSKPFKEQWYIQKRYFNHPIYQYEVYGVGTDNSGLYPLMMVFRVIKIDGTNIIRLIDCIGDYSIIEITTNLLDNLLENYNAEYVDCYETGLSEAVMTNAGFMKREDTDNIIPNYFSPFVQENIDIWFFSSDVDVVLFKGDGDQDRPN